MIMSRIRIALRIALPLVLVTLLAAVGAGAQELQGSPEVTPVAQQSLRPYWHVFLAYAIAITLIGGWAVSISRRLRAIEDRLVD